MSVRAAAVALTVLAAMAETTAGQAVTLHVRVTVADADGRARAVPRHALLISDNPVTSAPQRVVTSIEGIADVRLKPGNYTIESDEPLLFGGKSYQWAQTCDVAAGRDTVLELNAANAIAEPAAAAGTSPAMNAASVATSMLIDWQHSVFAIWTPKAIGAAFLVDLRGLVATSQRLVGKATEVELQVSATKRIAARVIAADATADVAVLRIDPAGLVHVKPVALASSRDGRGPVAEGDSVFAIETSLPDRKTLATGIVSRVTPRTIVSNIHIDRDNAGVALFNAGGEVVALTTVGDEASEGGEVSSSAVRIDGAKTIIANALGKMQGAPPPASALPMEPSQPLDQEKLRAAARARAGSLSAYLVAAADFDVALMTPLLTYGTHHQGDRERGAAMRNPGEMQPGLRALEDFGAWSDYVSDYPPVLLIRITPKLVEGFWTTVARGAAATQGASIPPIRKIKTGFSKLRAFCGETEVTPIHPLRIEHRFDDTHVIDEGLYVYDPGALGPRCSTVRLQLYSEKDPDKPDTRVVDTKIVEQIRSDFAAIR